MKTIDRSGNRFQGSNERVDFNEVTEELMDKSNWGPEAWHMECINGRTELGYNEWLCERNKKNHVTEEAKMEITHEKKELFPNSKGALRRQALYINRMKAQEITEMMLGHLSGEKISKDNEEMSLDCETYQGTNIGRFIETCIAAMERCTIVSSTKTVNRGKVLDHVAQAIARQWPFSKRVTQDGLYKIVPKNPWEEGLYNTLREEYGKNRDRIENSIKEKPMMRWNAGEREAGFAELCTSNSGESQYLRQEQEWDWLNRRADEFLLRAMEQNAGFLSPDKERFQKWHKALMTLVSATRQVQMPVEDEASMKARKRAWSTLYKMRDAWAQSHKGGIRRDKEGNITKVVPMQKSWSPGPKSVLMLYSARIKTQMVLRHITYNQWLSLAEKVARVFIALGCNGQKPSDKGLPGRDEEMILRMEEYQAWQHENWENMGDTQNWVPDEGMSPEELVALSEEYYNQ